jgi:hypothetical protein
LESKNENFLYADLFIHVYKIYFSDISMQFVKFSYGKTKHNANRNFFATCRYDSDELTVRAGSTIYMSGGSTHRMLGGYFHTMFNSYPGEYDVAILVVGTDCDIPIDSAK